MAEDVPVTGNVSQSMSDSHVCNQLFADDKSKDPNFGVVDPEGLYGVSTPSDAPPSELPPEEEVEEVGEMYFEPEIIDLLVDSESVYVAKHSAAGMICRAIERNLQYRFLDWLEKGAALCALTLPSIQVMEDENYIASKAVEVANDVRVAVIEAGCSIVEEVVPMLWCTDGMVLRGEDGNPPERFEQVHFDAWLGTGCFCMPQEWMDPFIDQIEIDLRSLVTLACISVPMPVYCAVVRARLAAHLVGAWVDISLELLGLLDPLPLIQIAWDLRAVTHCELRANVSAHTEPACDDRSMPERRYEALTKDVLLEVDYFVRIHSSLDGALVHQDTRDFFLAGLPHSSPFVGMPFRTGSWFCFTSDQLAYSTASARISMGMLVGCYGAKNNSTVPPALSVAAARRLLLQSPINTFLIDRMVDETLGDVLVPSWHHLCAFSQDSSCPLFDFSPLN